MSSMSQDAAQTASLHEAAPDSSISGTLPVPACNATNHSKPVPRDFFLVPVPAYLRRNPEEPVTFSLPLNIAFAVATTFIVANLYWCQPILIRLSLAFDVSYDTVSNVPTLVQGGYAAGMLAIAPLGDLVRRRSLILLLTLLCIVLSLGVAVSQSFVAFEVLSFFVGSMTCVVQVLIPLAADLAPPEKRASSISIVISGLLLGILLARVVAGVVAQFASWRVVYYLAVGLQIAVLAMLYAVLPDFPVKNMGITYWGILRSMAWYSVTEPVLIQACLVCMVSMACFANFWVTLTFLLGGEPYNYSTLVIGLFGLVGMVGVFSAPLTGRLIDKLIPWLAAVIATIGLLVFAAVQTGAGGVNIAAVVLVCFGIDVFRQMQQVALSTSVFGIEPKASSRMNSILLITIFAGQIMGTSVGTHVFVKYGWRPAASLSIAWTAFTLLVMLLRGPHCSRYTWFGYEGGYRMRKAPSATIDIGVPPTGNESSLEGKPGADSEPSGSEGMKVEGDV